MFKCFHSTSPSIVVCTRPHECIVLLWQEAIACANKVLLYCIVLYYTNVLPCLPDSILSYVMTLSNALYSCNKVY
jgi:hypothetical protein